MALLWITTTILLLGTLCFNLSQGANITDVRLGNVEPNGRSGRLEVQVDGTTWGVVCDDGWTDEDNSANVVVACRSLGFTNGGKAELTGKYGQGSGVFLLDDASCTSDMTTLAQCLSAQLQNCDVTTDKAVGVDCNAVGPGITTFQPPATTKKDTGSVSDNCQGTATATARLFSKDGVTGMGLVEVQNPNTNQWGFVCDDGWDANAAKVVCEQMCFPTNYTAKPGIPAEHFVTPENPTIILDNLACAGNENTLQDCPSNNFGANDCSAERGEFAGVQCVEAEFEPPSPPDPQLLCGGGRLQADFFRSRDKNLEEKYLSVLNDPNCADVQKSTTDAFVSIIIPVDKCGTQISRNGTHIIYDNDIKYASTFVEGAITRVNTYKVSIQCTLPVDKVVTQRVQAVTEAVTETADGVIEAGMSLYRSDSFKTSVTENPVKIPLGEFINLGVKMEDYDPRLKLVVTDCVSTPTGDTSNTRLTKVLLEDKCKKEKTLSTYPMSKFEFGIRFKPFKFVNYPLLYIQCDSIICLVDDVSNECDRTCNNTKPTPAPSTDSKRRRRRRAGIQEKRLTSPAILLYDPHSPVPTSSGSNNKDNDDEIKFVIIEDEETTPSPLQIQTSQHPLMKVTTTPVGNQQDTPLATSPPGKIILNDGDEINDAKNDDSMDDGSGASISRSIISLLLLVLIASHILC